ncbi:MAG: SRPBCC family protein [Pseudomonadota bacterium]
MDRQTELALIDELRALKSAKSVFLDEAVGRSPVSHYTDPERFAAEREQLHRRFPTPACHVSELPEPGAFLTRRVAGTDILVTRDRNDAVRAFHNVCRHRGTRLVGETRGCRHRFSCPYHAWTYASSGELLAAPQFDAGFPGVEKSDLGLAPVGCAVRYGFVWIAPAPSDAIPDAPLPPELVEDFTQLGLEDMVIAVEHEERRAANWKILIEGGIEAYHFRVAHRATIGPYFENNLSSYARLGPHLRSVLPRTTLAELPDDDRDAWRLRDHANILYTLFPLGQFLVQQDHVVWIAPVPVAADRTDLRLATLVPKARADDTVHWERNHAITRRTLAEDFDLAESIQAGLTSGANDELLFGRFEGALDVFNRTVAEHLRGR